MRKFITSIILVILALSSFGQFDVEMPERRQFVRVGIDVSRFFIPLIKEIDVYGYEFSIDGEIKYNFFPTLELGTNNISAVNDDMDYQMEGVYFRLGLNYNMLKYQHRLDRNIFFIGARYGYSSYYQETNHLALENDWGRYRTSLPREDLKQHFAEGVIGLRGEIFKNFFMGFTIRVKMKLSNSGYGDVTPYFIPGYGDGSKGTNAGMSYTMSYAIPIKKLN